MSQIESLICNQCSAPLEIPRGTSYVTCSYCHTNLKVHWEDSVSYTEKIEKLAEQNQQMLVQIAEIQYKQAFDGLLKSWETERQQYMIRKSDGSYRAPTLPLIPPITAIFIAIVGLLLAGGGFASHYTFLLIFGALIFLIGVTSFGSSSEEQVAAYQLAQQKYEEKIKTLKQEDFYQKLIAGSSKEGKQYVQSSFLQVLAAYQQKLSSF